MSAGAIIGEAWATYRAHWRHFIPLALVLYLVLSLVTLVLSSTLGWVGAIVSAVVSLVGVFWLQGALVEAVADVRDGRADLSIGETFARVRPRLGTLLVVGLLAALGIAVGLVLLVVPGLVLATWWSVVVPVIMLERADVMQAFGRSRQLVRGNGWSVFGVLVLTVLILLAATIVISLALVWLPEWLATYLGDVVGGSLTAPFPAIAWTLMYYALAERERSLEPGVAPA